ncbi:hypothetical protein V6N13_009519 [Hibiscus sabdariffa]
MVLTKLMNCPCKYEALQAMQESKLSVICNRVLKNRCLVPSTASGEARRQYDHDLGAVLETNQVCRVKSVDTGSPAE